ncbi:MAG: hypothetical protein ACRD5F_07525 [Candidatus Acidiferrales bacterium]
MAWPQLLRVQYRPNALVQFQLFAPNSWRRLGGERSRKKEKGKPENAIGRKDNSTGGGLMLPTSAFLFPFAFLLVFALAVSPTSHQPCS